MGHASGRTHVLHHSCCCPFKWPGYTFLDHWFWVVVLDTLYPIVPLFKNTSVFPSMTSLLKAFILGYPFLTWCLGYWWDVQHPPLFEGASGPWALPTRSPFPPLQKGHFPSYDARISSPTRTLSQIHGQPHQWHHNLPSSCLQADLRQHLSKLGIIQVPKG